MKKKSLIFLIVAVLFVAGLFFIAPRFTGKIINYTDDDTFVCSETDSGKEYGVKGVTKQGDVEKGSDYCTSEIILKEYYCLSETSVSHSYHVCPDKCIEGACVDEKEDINIIDEVDEIIEKTPEGVDKKDKIETSVRLEETKETGELPSQNIVQRIINWIKRFFS